MDVDIVAIGHELLMGEVVDTNSSYLAAHLPPLGLRAKRITQVEDEIDHLIEVLSAAIDRSPIVLTTGGLGPTEDDLTREAIARSVKEEIFIDEKQLKSLRNWFAGRGVTTMPPRNIKQAHRIPSATWLRNPLGTADGWWVEKDGHIIVALPGPPHELHRMWEHEVKPRLAAMVTGTVILTHTIKTAGMSEATLDELVSPFLGKYNPYIGVYAKSDGIHVRIIASGASATEAQGLIDFYGQEIQRVLGSHVWGIDDEAPEERVGSLLQANNLSLAVMESCTGGLLSHTLTKIPGSSKYFRGGIVAYTAESKIAYGVSPETIQRYGLVSEETALAMATAAKIFLNASVGIGVTGVAGPEPMEDKPQGLVYIGIALPSGTRVIKGQYPPGRDLVKARATLGALLGLWQELRYPNLIR